MRGKNQSSSSCITIVEAFIVAITDFHWGSPRLSCGICDIWRGFAEILAILVERIDSQIPQIGTIWTVNTRPAPTMTHLFEVEPAAKKTLIMPVWPASIGLPPKSPPSDLI